MWHGAKHEAAALLLEQELGAAIPSLRLALR